MLEFDKVIDDERKINEKPESMALRDEQRAVTVESLLSITATTARLGSDTFLPAKYPRK